MARTFGWLRYAELVRRAGWIGTISLAAVLACGSSFTSSSPGAGGASATGGGSSDSGDFGAAGAGVAGAGPTGFEIDCSFGAGLTCTGPGEVCCFVDQDKRNLQSQCMNANACSPDTEALFAVHCDGAHDCAVPGEICCALPSGGSSGPGNKDLTEIVCAQVQMCDPEMIICQSAADCGEGDQCVNEPNSELPYRMCRKGG